MISVLLRGPGIQGVEELVQKRFQRRAQRGKTAVIMSTLNNEAAPGS